MTWCYIVIYVNNKIKWSSIIDLFDFKDNNLILLRMYGNMQSRTAVFAVPEIRRASSLSP